MSIYSFKKSTKLLKFDDYLNDMIEYGWGSETLRVSVNNDGLVNLNWLKIKSNGSAKVEMLAILKMLS
jgi:hypothetical protein